MKAAVLYEANTPLQIELMQALGADPPEFIHFGLILHPPAREERGERELGEDDELGAHRMAFAQQLHQALGGVGAAVGTVERAELGGGNLEVSAHAPILGAPRRLLR